MGELAVGRAGKVGEWQNQGEDVGKLRDGEGRAEASCKARTSAAWSCKLQNADRTKSEFYAALGLAASC